MKKITTLLLLSTLVLLPVSGKKMIQPTDTVIYLDNKKIEVKESNSRIKVYVYERGENGEFTENDKTFEGHYRDGKSYENRVHSRNLVIPTSKPKNKPKRYIDPHWAGIGIGFANFSDSNLNINDVDGVSVRSGKSLEYNLNFWEEYISFTRFPLAFVTGMGFRYTHYSLDGVYLTKVDRETVVANPGPDMDLRKSRLNVTALTIPFLLEWQPGGYRNQFYLSAGVVGVVKLSGASRIRYRDEDGNKYKRKEGGLHMKPVTCDLQVQAGLGDFGIYAKYSPVTAFERNKGPKLHPVTLGLAVTF